MTAITRDLGILNKAGAPVNGVDSVQTLSITGSPDGGSTELDFDGEPAVVPFDATAADVQAVLEALPNIGPGRVVCSGGPLPDSDVVITFAGREGGKAQPAITTTDSLTGGTDPASAIEQTVTGVNGSYRGAPSGQLLLDTTNAKIYRNEGNAAKVIWAEPAVE